MSNGNGDNGIAWRWATRHCGLLARIVCYIITGTAVVVAYGISVHSHEQRLAIVEGQWESQQVVNSDYREKFRVIETKLDAITANQSEMGRDIKMLLMRASRPTSENHP